jgi:2-polyprenyl-3-methyl-5-hydroxy-6-metoxy-1,4-benzoquinol methylase
VTQASASQAPAEAVPTGNVFDKYGSRNPLVRRLMSGFEASLDELWDLVRPESVVDVGCGEGVLTEHFAQRLGDGRVIGVDVESPALRSEWAGRRRPNLEFRVGEARSLPFADDEFDVAAAIEVLEHVAHPEEALGELARVARRALLVSVPREPLWRALNVARGAYWRELGNTPGHVNHWSRRGFIALLGRYGSVEAVRSPPPWTLALVTLG